MDVNSLMNLVTSASSTGALSQNTGVSTDQISSILGSVMPSLLNGASAQATNASTASGFLQALDAHGKNDTSDLSAFLGGVDLADGAKIVQHLLGGSTGATTSKAAKAAGVSESDVSKILAMVSPLLMSVLGQQNKKHGNSSSSLLQTIISSAAGGGIDTGSILGMLGKLMK